MAEPKDVRDLVGEDLPPEELERLRRVHELLIAAGPPPELSPALEAAPRPRAGEQREGRLRFLPRRRLGTAFALAGGIAAIGFGAGFFVAHVGRGFDVNYTVEMRGTAAAPRAVGSVDVGEADSSGNVPMVVHVRGLSKLSGRSYYELYVTRNRRPVLTCGTFNAGRGQTSFRFSVPYKLKRFDGWVVTRERPGRPHPGAVVMAGFKGDA